MNTTPSRNLAEEMKKLEGLTSSPILNGEEYMTRKIQQIFQRVEAATITFHVRTLMFI